MPEGQGLSILRKADGECRVCGKIIEAFIMPFTGKLSPFLTCEECERESEAKIKETNRQARESHLRSIQENIGSYLEKAGVNKRYLPSKLSDFKGKLPESAPCFITGPIGTGKTHMAVGYLREWILQGNSSPVFVRAVDLFKQIRDSFEDKSQWTEMELLNYYGKEAGLLVIDDLGTEKVSDFVEQTLYDIIDQRYADELPFTVTSNLSVSQLASHYTNHGDRLASRIVGSGEVFEIKGKDKRI